MIHERQAAQVIARTYKNQGKTIVLATGFFDLLHQEHKNFLQKAKQEGDILIVCVESDQRARQIKGEGRPKERQVTRARKLDALSYVNDVVLLPDNFNNDQEYQALLSDVKPDVYAVSEHTPYQEKKRAMASTAGAVLKTVHKYNPRVSTTILLKSND